ncbi:hypothetical protein IFT72_14940 [Frigoribacterium sp. CFBP 8754]|uniref:hypothetical protein n=1 Tax=Frigoribacterium sp. CFBP 8754 TaxID=2775290 RepID=UPI001781991F|nr:hypothetical protein [Frigoribacterium sp. CFBP 8754]MBD8661483.1 hypothetical protein [Frigoribacterium sp. CFBP 8754]
MKPPKRSLSDEDAVANWGAVQRNSPMWLYRNGELHLNEPVLVVTANEDYLEYGDPEELRLKRTKPVRIWADGDKPTEGWQIRRL